MHKQPLRIKYYKKKPLHMVSTFSAEYGLVIINLSRK